MLLAGSSVKSLLIYTAFFLLSPGFVKGHWTTMSVNKAEHAKISRGLWLTDTERSAFRRDRFTAHQLDDASEWVSTKYTFLHAATFGYLLPNLPEDFTANIYPKCSNLSLQVKITSTVFWLTFGHSDPHGFEMLIFRMIRSPASHCLMYFTSHYHFSDVE